MVGDYMRNPLNKRLKRDLKNNLGRYMTIFVMFLLTISMVSGFLVAGSSMKISYEKGIEENNVEDGRFTLKQPIRDENVESLEDLNIKIYENNYIKVKVLDDSKIVIYKNRKKVDKVSLFEGKIPNKKNEIAIDRLFAKNNDLKIGDEIKVKGVKNKIVGLVALSDYSGLFQNNSDLMLNAHDFGVAVVDEKTFDQYYESEIKYNYSFTFNNKKLSDKQKRDKGKDITSYLYKNTQISDFLLAIDNQCISFAGDDMGSDIPMMTVLLYIVIGVMAFIFAVIILSTIESESTVIGTLLSNGYTKREILSYYMKLPMIVTFVASIIGNILGYAFFKNIFADMYYNSYCFPPYKTIWSSDAFIKTTIIPIVIITLINIIALMSKLSITPLRFLRNDLKRKKKKHSIKLPNVPFLSKFRIRVLFQNKGNYFILFIGIFIASILLMFGLMMKPYFQYYKDLVSQNSLATYQYALKNQVEVDDAKAEKATISSMKTYFSRINDDIDISVYGMQQNSRYLKGINLRDNDKEIYISDGLASKLRIEVGDTITLKNKYTNKEFKLKVKGTYNYPAALSVFINQKQLNDLLEYDEGYFNSYFSDKKLKISSDYLANTITKDDLSSLADQLITSFDGSISMIVGFSIIMYLVIMYLLTKVVIEKNAVNMSLLKVLGYENKEIKKVYLKITTIVVILSLIICLPIEIQVMKVLFDFAFLKIEGYLPFYIPNYVYLEIVGIGLVSYLVINFLHVRKVNNIDLSLALKERE